MKFETKELASLSVEPSENPNQILKVACFEIPSDLVDTAFRAREEEFRFVTVPVENLDGT